MPERIVACVFLIFSLVAPAQAEQGSGPPVASQAARFLSTEAAVSAQAREANPTVDRIENLRGELVDVAEKLRSRSSMQGTRAQSSTEASSRPSFPRSGRH